MHMQSPVTAFFSSKWLLLSVFVLRYRRGDFCAGRTGCYGLITPVAVPRGERGKTGRPIFTATPTLRLSQTRKSPYLINRIVVTPAGVDATNRLMCASHIITPTYIQPTIT